MASGLRVHRPASNKIHTSSILAESRAAGAKPRQAGRRCQDFFTLTIRAIPSIIYQIIRVDSGTVYCVLCTLSASFIYTGLPLVTVRYFIFMRRQIQEGMTFKS